MKRNKRTSLGFSLVELMIVISIISILALIGTVNYSRSRARANYQACVANEKNMGTAMEMYAHESGGRYPTTLASLTPKFISRIPTCPAIGATAPYSSGYSSASSPDAYTLVCSGNNHPGVSAGTGYPQFTSQQGLKEQ